MSARGANPLRNMLALLGYSLVCILAVLFASRDMQTGTRLILVLVTLIILNGPALLGLLRY